MRIVGFLLALISLFTTVQSFARLEDVIEAERKRVQEMNKRFGEVTSDKNVMGEAMTFLGQKISSPQKQRYDSDGGKMLTFQGDLTHHKKPYDTERETEEKEDPNDPKSPNKVERLYGWVSEHGAIKDENGGSSELERKGYAEHEKYTKGPEDQKAKNAPEGVDYISMFKRTTLKAAKAAANGGGNKGGGKNDDKNNEEDAIERWEIREESLEPIAKVGDTAFTTVDEVARSSENRNDKTTMGNGVFFLEVGSRALKALEAATKAAIGQRRANQGIEPKGGVNRVQMNEDAPTCQAWAAQAQAKLGEEQDEKRREEMQQEIQRMTQQCDEMSKVAFDAAQPKYEPTEDGKSEKLEIKGIKGEDGRLRDLRIQAKLLKNFGLSPNEVPSEWQYNENDGKGKITLSYDGNGRPAEQKMMSPQEQLEIWNQEKLRAKQAAQEANQLLPEGSKVDTSKLDQLAQKGQKAAWEITKIPEQVYDEFGAKQAQPMPQFNEYGELVQQ